MQTRGPAAVRPPDGEHGTALRTRRCRAAVHGRPKGMTTAIQWKQTNGIRSADSERQPTGTARHPQTSPDLGEGSERSTGQRSGRQLRLPETPGHAPSPDAVNPHRATAWTDPRYAAVDLGQGQQEPSLQGGNAPQQDRDGTLKPLATTGLKFMRKTPCVSPMPLVVQSASRGKGVRRAVTQNNHTLSGFYFKYRI
jgi:hypothetical protein